MIQDSVDSLTDLDLHIHTTFSDGNNTLEEICEDAIEKGLKRIAITDHITSEGEFYRGFMKKTRRREVKEYLKELSYYRNRYRTQLDLFIGAEISTDVKHPHLTVNNPLIKYLDFFDFFLIEGYFIENPIASALTLMHFIKTYKNVPLPVLIAHPPLEHIGFVEFKMATAQGIGWELNSAKIRPLTIKILEEYISELSINDQQKIYLSQGSDAHDISRVGKIYTTARVIKRKGWISYLRRFFLNWEQWKRNRETKNHSSP